ncbi:MAG: pectin acetylesterase-family hydrolase [Polaribacter sp.]|uniref:pectin acetylesterase-family hydrolase n=1 Tax=Polaribacter sp. TaxID=1920175 RepID=UPI00384CB69A
MKNLFLFLCAVFIFISCSKADVINDAIDGAIDENGRTLLEVASNYPNKASWIENSEMKSRNGDAMGYGVYLNPNSKKLAIFLDGGGACFNGFTCSNNRDRYSEEDFLTRVASENALIINRNSDKNQFKDWNFVFVPYATGDVHSGSNTAANVPNGGPKNQTMVGFNNFTLVLKDLKNYFEDTGGITEIVFMGSSAGGFGVISNTLQLADILGKNIPTTVIVDAGQILMDETLLTSCLASAWDTLWNFSAFLPEDLDQTVQKTYEHDIQKVYEYVAVKLPAFNFGFLSYYEDNTNRGFYSFGQEECAYFPTSLVSGAAFKRGLLNLKTTVLDDLENWKVFYANGELHTFLNDENLDQTVNNTNLNDWIAQLRAGTALNVAE